MRNKKIVDALELLKNGTISALDFINRVLYKDDNLSKNLSTLDSAEILTADDETELRNQIQAEVLLSLSCDMEAAGPSNAGSIDTSHNNSSLLSELDLIEETKEGACQSCRERLATVVFLPCAHNAVCGPCFELVEKAHVEMCHRYHNDNPRKLRRELSRLKCPNCNAVASNTIKTHINSYN